ncbi:MAG: hypothetical protein WD270_08725 [Acetobacterales bacterium]
MLRSFLTAAWIAILLARPSVAGGMTEAEVAAAQQAWGEGIVAIGRAHSAGGNARETARRHIDSLYAYGLTAVLFKPTKAAEDQFRETPEQALSYFVGGGPVAEDHGFAINPWTKVRFENHGTVIDADSAIAMGNYYFTAPSGEDVKVEYTFGYIKDSQGRLRVNLHHSSLPYSKH